MAESNTPIVVFGIIALVIIGLVVLVIFNLVPTIIDSPYHIEEGKIVKQSDVDLRLIALPYLTSTDVEAACLEAGATWHEDSDMVGCEGFGPADCNTAIVISAMTQCIGAGGNWTCGPDGIYCSL